MPSAISWSYFSFTGVVMSLAMTPGQTSYTLMPCSASRSAKSHVIICIGCLAIGVIVDHDRMPLPRQTHRNRPPNPARSAGNHCNGRVGDRHTALSLVIYRDHKE